MNVKILFLGIIALLLSSCASDVENYSCNKTVDKWVKGHITEIRSMDRTAWLNSAPEKSLGIYRAFTAEQKFNFWLAKFDEVKQLEWSEAELNHIVEAEDFIKNHRDFFEFSLSVEQQDLLEGFFYKWKKYGTEVLGWEPRLIYAIAASGLKLENKSGNVVALSNPLKVNALQTLEVESNCDCNIEDDFCYVNWGAFFDCQSANCKESSYGCGWVWLQSCDGQCQPA